MVKKVDKKKYTVEFKKGIIRQLLRDGAKPCVLSKKNKFPVANIYNWKRNYEEEILKEVVVVTEMKSPTPVLETTPLTIPDNTITINQALSLLRGGEPKTETDQELEEKKFIVNVLVEARKIEIVKAQEYYQSKVDMLKEELERLLRLFT